MTSYFDTTIGQREQFDRLLAQAGFTAKDIKRVLAKPSLAGKMYEAIREPYGVIIASSHQVYEAAPSWLHTPEQQLERAHQLWPDIYLPDPPKVFVPRTSTEVLLLHVPRPFDELWGLIEASGKSSLVSSDGQTLRLQPNVPNRTQPMWLAFDPEHGKGKRPVSFWGRSDLAASEVLSALIQFPDWPLEWRSNASAPNLSGYQIKHNNAWSNVPTLLRLGKGSHLRLIGTDASSKDYDWSSPTVREC